MIHGILVVNKERGFTSHQVVAGLRRILRQSAIGHTGTLDPDATGVLVVGLGEATRSFQFLDECVKLYRAEVILGRSTDTQDASGNTLAEEAGMRVGRSDIESATRKLTGALDQIPPMYSAVKVNGQKLYDLARQGLEIERSSRKITVFKWENTISGEFLAYLDSFWTEITCSKGTYIRTLIHDLGMLLGCGAHMGNLVRLRSGHFGLEEALTLSDIERYHCEGSLAKHLIGLDEALVHLERLTPEEADLVKLSHGGKLSWGKYPLPLPPESLVRATDRNSRVVAVLCLKATEDRLYWQPVKVFNV
jgi:tRNA pseudouridine55 synthase